VSARTPLQRVHEALDPLGRGPMRRLSQNFLIDPNTLRSIVDALCVTPGTPVLEVGPGPGTLTAELLAAGARVTAVELDRDLAAYLRGAFGDADFELIEGDVLRCLPELPGTGEWLVATNLPYAITSPFLELLVDWHPRVARAVVTVQREVAERVVAREGTPDRGSLSAFVQRYYEPKVARIIPPEVFLPQPRVHSAVLTLRRRDTEGLAPREAFERVLRGAFGQRRKMLRRALASPFPREWVAAMLSAAGLTGEERAEEVPACAFEAMAATLTALEEERP
jgi:16S rRNA (adenine1518-N6/adenine1519-N6)-dimethyltransferase